MTICIPPPRPSDSGMVTPMQRSVEMAASTAFPPASNIFLFLVHNKQVTTYIPPYCAIPQIVQRCFVESTVTALCSISILPSEASSFSCSDVAAKLAQ